MTPTTARDRNATSTWYTLPACNTGYRSKARTTYHITQTGWALYADWIEGAHYRPVLPKAWISYDPR